MTLLFSPLDQTVPLYQARNIAISHVKTKYCAFLDVDDLWHPSCIYSAFCK